MKILDHGYLKIVESWGSEERIVEAARMSTGKGFLGWAPGPCPLCDGGSKTTTELNAGQRCNGCDGKGEIAGDLKLLRHLYDNRHATPFEMAGLVIEVKAPIMVFREWHRHRTQSYNEMSARYIPLPNENYSPTIERVVSGARGAGGNKQAQGKVSVTEADALEGLSVLADAYDVSQRAYERLLVLGWPKELARLPVTVARYSRMRASANLRNWLGFMTLRSTLKNEAAQYEIRQYADALGTIIAEAFPRTWELFNG